MKSFYSNLIIIKRYYKKPVFSLYLLHKTICMRTSIHIGALHFYAHHGVLPQEQKVGNYFKVETTLYTDFSRALVTDELTDTLNYAEVCKIISDEMAIPSRLLEHVAGRITNSLRSHYNRRSINRYQRKASNPRRHSRCVGHCRMVDLLPKLTASGYFVDSPLMAAALETGIQKYVDYLSAKFSRNKSAGHN